MNLKEIYFFEELDDATINLLEQHSMISKYTKDNVIFYEGDEPKYLHLLLTGIIKLYKSTSNNKEIIMKYFTENELIAELTNFDNMPYPATAVAHVDCEVLKVDFEKFKEVMYKNEDMVMKIQSSLIKKIKNLERLISSQLVLDTHQRVAKYIVENGNTFFETKNIFIAQVLNITPETLSRVLRSFKDKKYIDMNKKEINEEELLYLYK